MKDDRFSSYTNIKFIKEQMDKGYQLYQIDRETLLGDKKKEIKLPVTIQHNALYDAWMEKWIYELYIK
ncbi:MAG: hypothetical protein IPL31_17535 [Saprospiraceae bacterium]|nr:hypothetical protein [Saprospiraceae bacterium]